jgi:glyoxylase-like metal-dependent hydrolase (beta-lactamase superfamily II)
MSMMNLDWFSSHKIRDGLYVIKEHHFFEGNRCNIYLIKGPSKDVVIDTGLGVSDLRYYLQGMNLIDGPGGDRDCIVICTHNHFDHSGGAHHFDNVFIHEDDMIGLRRGQQTETLNYVKGMHFYQQPFRGFSAFSYKVPPTQCHPIQDGDKIDLGGGEHLEVMHYPGHTRGSIALYYPEKQELFSGDIVYECGDGGGLLDWLPNSNVQEYLRSANRLSDWLSQNQITTIYPGHFKPMTSDRAIELLLEYTETKDNPCSQGCMTCLQHTTWWYFLCGCFRCCPC